MHRSPTTPKGIMPLCSGVCGHQQLPHAAVSPYDVVAQRRVSFCRFRSASLPSLSKDGWDHGKEELSVAELAETHWLSPARNIAGGLSQCHGESHTGKRATAHGWSVPGDDCCSDLFHLLGPNTPRKDPIQGPVRYSYNGKMGELERNRRQPSCPRLPNIST